ncbi:MAG TPA: LamG-like jellyroll fold domain-containing protein, partial [Acidimicrobiales bacterium]|nr:LamG-like jellyroll fold domain-containing protein [Acidimicrobiales bacterium]
MPLLHTALASSDPETNYESAVEAQGPTSFWPLQSSDTSGSTSTDVMGIDNATIGSTVVTDETSGPFGESSYYNFPGGSSGSCLNPGTNSGLGNPSALTLSAWVDPAASTQHGLVFLGGSGYAGGSNGYWLRLDGLDPTVTFGGWITSPSSGPEEVSGATSTVTLPNSAWSFIAGTYSGSSGSGTFRVYVDGVLEGSQTYSTSSSNSALYTGSSDSLVVGNDTSCGSTNPYLGAMSEAAWSPSALNARQVATDCQAGAFCPPLTFTAQGTLLASASFGGGDLSAAQCPCSTSTGSVADATGDFSQSETDLSVPGAGVPLAFTRTYDAVAAQGEAAASAASGPFGYGWTDNLAMSVAWNSVADTATVTQENGSQVTFDYYAQGATESLCSGLGSCWCPTDSTSPVFCPVSPSILATLTTTYNGSGQPDGPWTFTRNVSNPLTFTFTSAGVLTTITDQVGNTLSSGAYSPGSGEISCPSGDTCTAWTSSASGRSIVIAVKTSTSYLDQVFEPQTGSSPVGATYKYTGSGCSTWGSGPVDLCQVNDSDGLDTSFTYTTSAGGSNDWNITTLAPPAAGEITNDYNSSGHVTEEDLATASGVSQVTKFAYGSSSTAPGDSTTTIDTYPSGTSGSPDQVVDTFADGVLVATSVAGGASTNYVPDPVSLLPLDTIDPDGHLSSEIFDSYDLGGTAMSSADVTSSTDGDANATYTDYTSSNEPWCSVSPAEALDGVTCPSTIPSMPAAGSGMVYTSGHSSTYGNVTGAGPTLTYYNSAGEVVGTTDARGYTDQTAYTSDGLAWCSVDAVAYSVSGVSCPGSVPSSPPTTATGYTTTLYDSAGDVTSVTD